MTQYGKRLRENVERYIGLRDRILATALTHAETIQYCQESL